jgi:excisionase family DNA binding protein
MLRVRESILKLLTITEVVTYLGVSRGTIYRMIAKGRLNPVRLGRIVRFNIEQVEELSKARQERKDRASRKRKTAD